MSWMQSILYNLFSFSLFGINTFLFLKQANKWKWKWSIYKIKLHNAFDYKLYLILLNETNQQTSWD